MAYLGCPFCPAQAVPANVQDKPLEGLVKFRCIGSGHMFYIGKEELECSQPTAMVPVV
jgi:hypothetical protein